VIPTAVPRLGPAVLDRAERQGGVVSRRQLLDLGASGSAVSRWVQDGRLQRLHRGVYAVGHARLRTEGRWWAALLAGGEGAVLCSWTAAAAWDLVRAGPGAVHVRPARSATLAVPGIHTHRYRLHPDDRGAVAGLPVTSVARTVLDVAATASEHRLGAVLDRALQLGRLDVTALDAAMVRGRGTPGVARLRAALARITDQGEDLRSRGERVLRDALVAAAVARPAMNVWLPRGRGRGITVDLLWPRTRLVVEVDERHHELPFQRLVDVDRDRWLRSRGYAVLRIPEVRLGRDLDGVVAEIAAALDDRVVPRP